MYVCELSEKPPGTTIFVNITFIDFFFLHIICRISQNRIYSKYLLYDFFSSHLYRIRKLIDANKVQYLFWVWRVNENYCGYVEHSKPTET